MPREELAQTVVQMIARETDLSVDGITERTHLAEMGVDSLDILKLAVAFERQFDITITTADLNRIRTLGDIVDELERKVAIA
jgi:acyl carrier protein